MLKIGVDIGGTKTLIITKTKKIQFLTPKKSSEEFYNKISNEIIKLGGKKVGISFAGLITKKGKVELSPNIPNIKNTNFIKEFNKRNISLIVENDANCLALAKAKELKSKNLVSIIIGTGIGAGLIINGSLYKGNKGFAGEIGHGKIFAGKEYEDLIGGKSFDSKNISEKDLLIWHENLSKLTSQVLTFYNPEILVFGGGLTNILNIKLLKIEVKKIVDSNMLNSSIILKDIKKDVCAKGALLL